MKEPFELSISVKALLRYSYISKIMFSTETRYNKVQGIGVNL